MPVRKREEGLFAEAGVDGPLPFVDQIKFLQGGRGIAGFPLGRGTEDRDLRGLGNL
ncbi:MAG: hypothetical protein RL549_1364, partial [Verrucomicrobiota bacterium]